MYVTLLQVHNVTRWLVLVAALVAIAAAVHGLLAGRRWDRLSRIASAAFVGTLDLQVILGLILFVVSPLVRSALADMGAAMGTSELRFFVVEHSVLMVVAAVVAHVGSVAARRATTDPARHIRALTLYGAALALVLFAIPWWRPLFPGLG